MNKHNYTALTTFRGWDEDTQKWVYGYLGRMAGSEGKQLFDIQAEDGYYEVNEDSIGVYTGKDDKDGNGIFCGVAGAKYGGDNLLHENNGIYPMKFGEFEESVNMNEYSNVGYGFYIGDDTELEDYEQFHNEDKVKITSTQWEEHIKAAQ